MTAAPPIVSPAQPASLEYPFTAPPTDGPLVEVAPGVLWARIGMPMALSHINVWLLRGDDGWTIVDTGLSTDETRALWEHIIAERLDGAPVRALVCTHFHYDHAGLASWMTERFGVPLYMSLGEFLMMRMLGSQTRSVPQPEEQHFYARAGMPQDRVERVFEALRQDPFVPPRQDQFRRLRAGDVLTIGPRRWQVLIGEGHSPEHVCLYSAEDRLLIGGDQLLPRITSNVMVTAFEPEGNPLALWFESLDRLETCAEGTLVLPSHQNVFRGVHARVGQLREHHQQQRWPSTTFSPATTCSRSARRWRTWPGCANGACSSAGSRRTASFAITSYSPPSMRTCTGE